MKQVIVQTWSEHDDGFRPDGFTLHLTKDDLTKYIEKHNKNTPVYSLPDEQPYIGDVDDVVYAKLLVMRHNGEYGIWKYEKSLPPHTIFLTSYEKQQQENKEKDNKQFEKNAPRKES